MFGYFSQPFKETWNRYQSLLRAKDEKEVTIGAQARGKYLLSTPLEVDMSGPQLNIMDEMEATYNFGGGNVFILWFPVGGGGLSKLSDYM